MKTANQVLLDLQSMTDTARSQDWRMKRNHSEKLTDFYRVVDAQGKMVFTVAFQKDDHQTRILVEALLTKGHSLVAGASLTMQMYVATEEILACQRIKEIEGITDAYNNRNAPAWAGIKSLMSAIRVSLGRFATVKDLQP